jgi:hypothetical protein
MIFLMNPVQTNLSFHPAGILTHIKLKANKKEDHPDARGLNIVVPYNRDACQKLLQILADAAADTDMPADYDFCVTVISNSLKPRPAQPLEDDGFSGPAPRAMARAAPAADDDSLDLTSAMRHYGYSAEDIKEFEEVG